MPSLAVFDFDRTVVDDDSDATIIRRLKERQPPPEWDSTNHDWTPYMSDVFEHAFSAGLSQEDILASIACMRATPGLPELFTRLAAEGWDILLLTDANTVFVKHWLKTHELDHCITSIITNGAFFESGRLHIEPCMRQAACARCPANLCKALALHTWCKIADFRSDLFSWFSFDIHNRSEAAMSGRLHIEPCMRQAACARCPANLCKALALHTWCKSGRLHIEPCMRQAACARCPANLCKALALHTWCKSGRLHIEPCMRQAACARCPANLCKALALHTWCKDRQYDRIVYSGDGRNDFCPATTLPASSTVFARRGYPLDDLIRASLASPTPQVKAKVVYWDDCYRIIEELFPEEKSKAGSE
ncbi:unnamed protein product [Plutella xylostella]|uniref:(diamondback moth) hypothetical protein n=1 Tax=Plutella xylostella TaxID=51655 RepID=A0A8S4E122_PLUXY|nr:unnamed protein product [Plutella xylostella]